MKKRIISAILLVFVAVVALIPTLSFNAEAADPTAQISFADKAQRTEYSTSKQVWTQNGITVTNNKASSTTNVGDYSNPARFYAKSSLTIHCSLGNITKIVIDCGGSSYATAMKNSATGTVTISGNTVTIVPSSTSDTYTIASFTAQARAKTITIHYTAACNHTNTSIVGAKDATCTEPGYTGDTVCSCGKTTATGSETEALGHKYIDGECENCGQADPDACAHTNTTTVDTATCTNDGEKTTTCDDCGEVQSVVTSPAKGHTPGAEATCTTAQTCTVCDAVITEALGHNCDDNGACSRCDYQAPLATFVVPNGAATVESQFGPSFTAPAVPALPEVNYNHEYTFVGWATSTQEDGTVAPTLHKAGSTVTISEDTTYYAVYQYVVGSTSTDYELVTDVNEISSSDVVVITMTKGGVVYAISHTNGASAPSASYTVTIVNGKISGTVSDDIKWNIANSNGNLTIYPNGTTAKWLYCTNTNNGVKVGTGDNSIFTVSGSYLKNTGTSRFLGVYNTQDWRCYTTNTGSSNIANQTLAFYVLPGSTTYYTTNLVERTCDHANTTDVVENPTCTEAGSRTTNCADCGEFISFEAIEATGHDYEGEITVAATCTEAGTYTYTCANCSDEYTEEIKATGHSFVDKKCSKCGIDQPVKVEISTSIEDYAAENGWANSTKYTNVSLSDCLTATVAGKDNSGKYYTKGYEWRLYQSENATLTFTANNGYVISSVKITYTSEDSGVLCMGDTQVKSGTVVNVNSDTVTFSIGNTGDDTAGKVKITAIEVTYQLPSEFTGASLNVGSDLSIRYHAFLSDDVNNYTVRFTMNDKVVEVAGVLENGKYVFTFCGITPQCMGDVVKAELLYNGEVIDTIEEYSVKNYVASAFEIYADNTNLLQFLSDMLYYGAEAQKYANYKTDALVTEGIELYDASTKAPAEDYDNKSIVTEADYDKTLAKFTAAGVNFDYNNRIYVKLNASDLENVELYVNGAALEIEELGEGNYIAYSYAISALEFENVVTFELHYNGELAQTLTYTIADYVVTMQDDAEIGSLVNALYNYGESAKIYDSNK